MNAATDNELEVDVAGQKVRARGYRLIDLVWLPMFLGIGWLIVIQQGHTADSKDEKIAMAQAAKEANQAVVRALQELVAEQKRSTNAAKEVACLNDPVMRNRQDAREFCKRMARDDR